MQWGRALLERGDGARARAQFQVAMKRSPKAHDAVQGAGEALLMAGKPTEAAKMFAGAAAQTPRWGRLHLQWGDCLAAQGQREAAASNWRAAAGVDLTAVERARVTALLQKQTT